VVLQRKLGPVYGAVYKAGKKLKRKDFGEIVAFPFMDPVSRNYPVRRKRENNNWCDVLLRLRRIIRLC
jgi:hypothetical protein